MLLNQLICPPLQLPLVFNVRRRMAQLHLQADEFRTFVLVAFFEIIGQHQSREVICRACPARGKKCCQFWIRVDHDACLPCALG